MSALFEIPNFFGSKPNLNFQYPHLSLPLPYLWRISNHQSVSASRGWKHTAYHNRPFRFLTALNHGNIFMLSLISVFQQHHWDQPRRILSFLQMTAIPAPEAPISPSHHQILSLLLQAQLSKVCPHPLGSDIRYSFKYGAPDQNNAP